MDVNQKIQSALQQYQAGNLQAAEDICRKILHNQPKNFQILNFLGVIHYQREDYDNAMGYFRKALRINPNFVEAYNNLGNVLKEKQQLDEAIGCYKKAIGLNPQFVLAYNGLGVVLHRKGCVADAIVSFQKALQMNPSYAEAYNNLGNAFREKGQFDEAVVCFQKALAINPGAADMYNNLGAVLQEKGEIDEAIIHHQKALIINPHIADAYNNLGLALAKKGLFTEAIDSYLHALALKPDFVAAYSNIGNTYKDLGHPHKAEESYRHALRIKPDCAFCFSNFLLLMNYNSGHDAQTIFAEHLRFSKQVAEPRYPVHPQHANDRSLSRRLRIGYVSPDFRGHSVAYFIEPVLIAHNREQFEIFCYSDVLRPDKRTERLQGHTDHWRNIAGMPDAQVAELIRKDGIDILIDLAGHTANNRMLLFARKPAPVQISWLGYPNTTGLSTIDYRIVDNYTDPPGLTDPFYTEKLIRMPESFLCYLPDQDSPAVGDLPAAKAGRVTFGSFNYFPKVSPETLTLWSEILKIIPGSRLIMKAKSFSDRATCNSILDLFERKGVATDRIELLTQVSLFKDHLNLYNRVDIGLDTFPYSGTTTTCEALWMGVPVVTLAGNTHASRVGVSLMSNIGLSDLVAKTHEEYKKIAVHLAADMHMLKSFRERSRKMIADSPLSDAARFTVNLENCYRIIWEKWRVSA